MNKKENMNSKLAVEKDIISRQVQEKLLEEVVNMERQHQEDLQNIRIQLIEAHETEEKSLEESFIKQVQKLQKRSNVV